MSATVPTNAGAGGSLHRAARARRVRLDRVLIGFWLGAQIHEDDDFARRLTGFISLAAIAGPFDSSFGGGFKSPIITLAFAPHRGFGQRGVVWASETGVRPVGIADFVKSEFTAGICVGEVVRVHAGGRFISRGVFGFARQGAAGELALKVIRFPIGQHVLCLTSTKTITEGEFEGGNTKE